jgi:hypothetical protein
MAVSIDAQAAINEIAAELGVDSNAEVSVAPQDVEYYQFTPAGVPISLSQIREASKSTPSTRFGDEEFLHEIGMYGTSDPVLRAAMRKFGANIASYVPAHKMLSKVGGRPPMGEAASLFPSGKFEQPLVNVRSDIKNKMDREYLNEVWRHEYRHMGLGLLQQSEEQTLMNKLDTYLSKHQGKPRYFSPLTTEMNKVFKPGYSWSGGLIPRPYGLGYKPGQSLSSEELTNRYMGFKYGLSDEYNKQIREDLQKYKDAGFYDISSENDLRSLLERIQKQAEGL